MNGILLNAGAFTHYSYAIRDALSTVKNPTTLSSIGPDVHACESFRHTSVIAPETISHNAGFGAYSYEHDLQAMIRYLEIRAESEN
ncbi:type II 3-dehydroquinate dehydratase [Paenibacillus sp. Marseille-Q4541]|uniref:type II 3-dehydroquinate dehydratase n=1 Tax=Paenibacillus sp. Marseille-Q4541 TaxID=2831522 RepID=UPI0032D5ABB9